MGLPETKPLPTPISLPKPYARLGQFPIDPTTHWEGDMLQHLENYVQSNPTAYEGQILTTIDRTLPGNEQKVEVWVIDVGRTLRKIGEVGAGGTIENIDASKVLLSEGLTVNGTSVGGVADGHVFEPNTTLDAVLKAMFQKAIHPTYNKPEIELIVSSSMLGTVALSNQQNVDFGVGMFDQFELQSQFIQNDAGEVNQPISLHLDGESVASSTLGEATNGWIYNLEFLVEDLTPKVSIKLLSSHDAGAIKQNNLGVDDARGQILAGEVMKEVFIRPYLDVSFEIDASGFENDIQQQVERVYHDTERIAFSINIPKDTEMVSFNAPMLRDFNYAVKVTYRELGGADVTDTFEIQPEEPYKVDMSPANYTDNRYVYMPSVPFPSAATYDVEIVRTGEKNQTV